MSYKRLGLGSILTLEKVGRDKICAQFLYGNNQFIRYINYKLILNVQ